MKSIPSYCLHKRTGQAYVRFGDEFVYLGKYGSEASHRKYERVVNEWLAGVYRDDASTVVELCAAYLEWATGYYLKNGEETREVWNVKTTIKRWRELYGNLDIIELRPKHLKALQQAWIQDGLTRNGVNRRSSIVKRILKWGVENEHVPEDVYNAIKCVSGLKKHRSEAPDNPPVEPIGLDVVDLTLTKCNATIGDMVRLQLLTGARPGEICELRPGYVNRTSSPWEYRPGSHKMEHHARARVIYFGPQAQKILLKYLARPANHKCFGYTTISYRRHIHRACDELKIDTWGPNRLRHTRGTDIRAKYGLDAARSVLGHTDVSTTSIYAEADLEAAKKIAREIG